MNDFEINAENIEQVIAAIVDNNVELANGDDEYVMAELAVPWQGLPILLSLAAQLQNVDMDSHPEIVEALKNSETYKCILLEYLVE